MSATDNKELMRRYYLEVWQNGDERAEKELVSPNYLDHMPLPGQPAGWEGHHHIVAMIGNAFPDARYDIQDLIAEGDRVVGRWQMKATHKDELLGIPATGRPLTMTGMDLSRWENGQLAEIWHIEDMLGMLQQLGVIPAPGQ